MRITVVGVGALGSHLVPLLRNVGADLRVIDDDRVESKNTLSQFHAVGSVRKPKTMALDTTMNLLWKFRLQTFPHRLVKDNVHELLSGSTLVVDCVDDGPTRELIQTYVREHSIPCLHGALAADGAYGRVVWDERFVADHGGEGQATCENGEHLPFISIVASYMAQSVRLYLSAERKVGYEINASGVFST